MPRESASLPANRVYASLPAITGTSAQQQTGWIYKTRGRQDYPCLKLKALQLDGELEKT